MLGAPMGVPVEVQAEGQTTSIEAEDATVPPTGPSTEKLVDTQSPPVGEKSPPAPEATSEDTESVIPTTETQERETKRERPKTVEPEKTESPPSPQKLALIRRLLQITEQKKNAEQRLEAMLANMEKTLPKVLTNVIRDRTQLQGDELLKRVTTTTQRMVKRYRELLPSRVNIGEITEEISTNLYAKYYTEQELQDLIDFYQTPTGRKAIATLPQLTQEALEQSNDILLPEITQLLKEIIQAEFGPQPANPSPDRSGTPQP